MIPESIKDLHVKSKFFFGSQFLKEILPRISEDLDIDFLLIGKLISNSTQIQSLVYSKNDDKFLPLKYDLRATPCELTTRDNYCCYESNVSKLFPDDYLLEEMQIEGYIGISFASSLEKVEGVIVALTHNPINNTNSITESLKLFQNKIAEEIKKEGVKILNPEYYQ